MAYYFKEPSHTFGEYLLVPGYSSAECIPSNVSLCTPLVKFKKGETPKLTMHIPMTSAIMQAVSNDTMAIALAKEGGISFIYGSQTAEAEAEMIRRVKTYKSGFVSSDSNLKPTTTLAEVLALVQQTGHSTMAVTEDGTPTGKLLGIVTSRDYRISRMDANTQVHTFMTPFEKLIYADADSTTLPMANDLIWEHKLNMLPLVDKKQRLRYMVFRKDYTDNKENSLELIDDKKRYIVGAGINTRDYAERVPLLLEAGADVLCIDSSEGYSEWQKRTLQYIPSTSVPMFGSVRAMSSMLRDFDSLQKQVQTSSRSASAAVLSASRARQRALAAVRRRHSLTSVRSAIAIIKKRASIFQFAPTAALSMITT